LWTLRLSPTRGAY